MDDEGDLQVHVAHVPATIDREVRLKRSRSFPIKLDKDLTPHPGSCCRGSRSGPLDRVGCNEADADMTDTVTTQPSVQDSQSPVLMNFDAFISGEQQINRMKHAKEDMVQPEVCFKSSNSDSLLDHDRPGFKETQDKSDSIANGASKRKTVGLLSIKSAAVAKAAKQLGHVKEKTQQVVQTQKQVISVFQQKGGLVGWLHGEGQTKADCDDGLATPVGSPSKEIHEDNDPSEENKSESPSNKTPPQTSPRVVLAPPQFKLDSLCKAGTPTAPRSPVMHAAAESSSQRQRSVSLFESIYEKMVKSLPDSADDLPTERRVALQPSPRKEVSRNDSSSFDFDDFVNSDGVAAKSKFLQDSNRARTVSAEIPSKSTALPSKSRSASLSAIESSTTPTAALTEQLSLEECLADPKLAAEFVNTVIPDDSSLLMLLYSIEEFETLVTDDPIPALQVQITYAMALIDKFLTPVKMSPLIKSKLPESTAVRLKQTLEQYHRACAPALPKTLFKGVYTELYTALRTIYDAFKQTREYTLIAGKQESDRPAMTMDAVLDNKWFSTVLWVFLYSTSHHQRLSFLLEKTTTLDRIYRAFLDANGPDEDIVAGSSVADTQNIFSPDQHFDLILTHLQSMSRKFFQKSSPMALPAGSSQLSRLKEEVSVEITHLDSMLDKPAQNAAIERIILKMDELAVCVQAEFKRVSFERFSSFTASALYRDFIDLLQAPNYSGDDLVRLLRASRISFHQTQNEAPVVPALSSLIDFSSGVKYCTKTFSGAISQAFVFTKHNVVNAHVRVQPFEYTNLFIADQGQADSDESVTVLQTVEHFLTPEASPRTLQLTDYEARQHLCFNFVAGSSENCLYGAVWRMPLVDADGDVTTQGICVLSRYPLMESLRAYLRVFASNCKGGGASEPGTITTMRLDACDHTKTMKAAKAELHQYLLNRRVNWMESTHTQIDFDLRDLFDCLSITHILRLFSLLLLEKKVVLVASRYSVLVAAGEALKSFLKPLVWSHIYVPVLPLALKGYLHCPTPFIFGVHASYVKNCELPRASEDLVIVNLDRDSLTGGGDVVLSPARMTALRDKLWKLCKPRLQIRDSIHSNAKDTTDTVDTIRDEVERNAPAICELFNDEVRDILMGLEACATRFECGSRCISVVESSFVTSGGAGGSSTTSSKSTGGLVLGSSAIGRSSWPSDAARFNSSLLQTQAFSAHLGSCRGCRK